MVAQYASAGYNAIHFAGHSNSEQVQLSGGSRLEADDIARIARDAKADLIFFNSCEAARLAAYAVAHGVSYAIAATIKLEDSDAWEFPNSFYTALANGAWRDILAAYTRADSGNGEYSLSISPAIYQDCEEQVFELKAKLNDTIILHPRTLLLITMLSLFSLFTVALFLFALSGRVPF